MTHFPDETRNIYSHDCRFAFDPHGVVLALRPRTNARGEGQAQQEVEQAKGRRAFPGRSDLLRAI